MRSLWNRLKPDLSLSQRRNLAGIVFVLPFTLGLIFFFLYPLFHSIVFSLTELEITREGFDLHFAGLANYRHALLVHPQFVRTLVETFVDLLIDIPLILVFSLFAAMLLNQQFKGRLLARVIFFLPVIMGAGIILRMEQIDYMTGMLQQTEGLMSSEAIQGLMMELRMPDFVLEYITEAVDRTSEIVNSSAIQILIFLAGLQSIPPSLYEAADVEGATRWENFWIITLPLLSPLILVNVVYTIIESFTSPFNVLVQLIRSSAFGGAGYGVSAAMSWIYFFSILVIIVIAFSLVSRWVFYQE